MRGNAIGAAAGGNRGAVRAALPKREPLALARREIAEASMRQAYSPQNCRSFSDERNHLCEAITVSSIISCHKSDKLPCVRHKGPLFRGVLIVQTGGLHSCAGKPNVIHYPPGRGTLAVALTHPAQRYFLA